MTEEVTCACGCGLPTGKDARGKPRRYVSGHNFKMPERKPRVMMTCRHCGREERMTAAAAKGRLYCSTQCRDDHRRSLTGSRHPYYNRTHMTCKVCGNDFEVTAARLRRGKLVYCSMECSRTGQARSLREKPRKVRFIGKMQAKRRDKFCCRLCGFDLAVHAHHIVPRREGGSNVVANIITLCPNHHASVHAGLISREELLAALDTPQPEGEVLYRARHKVNYRTGG